MRETRLVDDADDYDDFMDDQPECSNGESDGEKNTVGPIGFGIGISENTDIVDTNKIECSICNHALKKNLKNISGT